MMKKMLCVGMIGWCLALAFPLQSFSAKDPAASVLQSLVNINTATEAELEALPGIGPVSAQRIVAFRSERGRFTAIDQLVEVKGIGEKSLEKIRPLISVQ